MTSGFNKEKRGLLDHLAETYIRGKGVEIAGAPRPFPVPPGVCLQRVPESVLVKDDRETETNDKTLKNLDFCITGNTVQIEKDPLLCLHRCLQMLRPGGILFVMLPGRSNPPAHFRTVVQPLFSRVGHSPITDPDEGIRKIVKEERILTMPVRIRWQGAVYSAGSRDYLVVIERFDYLAQVQELLQKKAVIPENQPPCPVDVIIPVYNAPDDLLRCLYSVIVHHENERVILIDDKSTDPGIDSLFSSLEPFQSPRFIQIRQEKNRGFAATVNRGMQLSRNDVILLNSDTIVTKGWTKKLREGVGSQKNCGTMTPLSNNGTLTSVPVMMENNRLPPRAGIDDYADMVEKISLGKFPAIPAGIGFCLFITRKCLDITGYFDEVTYRTGYGEETDFCLRARESGMSHHVCDTTFIYHRGMASYSAGAMKQLKQGIAALDARYPSHQGEVSAFIQDNPLEEIQENIACRATTWDFSGCARRVLFITDTGSRNGNDRQTEGTAENRMYYVLGETPSGYWLSEYHHGNQLGFTFPADAQSPGTFSDIIEKILCSFRISCICLDHPDPRVSDRAEKFHIPCRIASSSSDITGAQGGVSGKTGDKGVSGEPKIHVPLRELQEPDWSSGRQFSSAEIFHAIKIFPEARFRGIIPFRPETSGSLPCQLFRCVTENGVMYTIRRIRFSLMHRNGEN